MLTLSHLRGAADALHLEWSDGVQHRLTWRVLRDRCPCATCANPPEPQPQSGGFNLLPVLSPAETRPLKVTAMRPMGNYAYSVQFSDGHNTGIYSLEFLRQLGEEAGTTP